MRALNIGLSFLLGIILLLSGCAALDRINAPTLSGVPTTSALVVVDCEAVFHGKFVLKTRQKVVGGELRDSDGFNPIAGRAISGLIIFSDVPPGEYYLARVNAVGLTYLIPPEKVRNLTVSTKVGDPRFLGTVTVEKIRKQSERGFYVDIIIDLKPSKEAELKAWRKFLQIYKDSPWDKAIRQRITEIET